MRILISGSTGLVGSELVHDLQRQGHEVVRLMRRRDPSLPQSQFLWDPAKNAIDPAAFEGCDALVNLSGENIAGQRWTAEFKQRLLTSRVDTTSLLARTVASLAHKPKVFVCASATGYYGHRGDEELDESSSVGEGVLPEICARWEACCQPALQAGVRVVNLRIGVVLTPKGGALDRMMTPFKLGVGGRLGTGRQWWSWVSLDDLLGAVSHAIARENLAGPVNAVSPQPVTNAQFTRSLARALHRPAFLPVPAFALRLALGEMADALLMQSQHIRPSRLLESGYEFKHPTLDGALAHLLSKGNP